MPAVQLYMNQLNMTVFKFSPSKVASLGTEAFAILTNRGATVQPTALELTKILIILDQLVLILRVRKERTSSLPSSSCTVSPICTTGRLVLTNFTIFCFLHCAVWGNLSMTRVSVTVFCLICRPKQFSARNSVWSFAFNPYSRN